MSGKTRPFFYGEQDSGSGPEVQVKISYLTMPYCMAASLQRSARKKSRTVKLISFTNKRRAYMHAYRWQMFYADDMPT